MTVTADPTLPFTLERARQLFPDEAFDGHALTVHVPAVKVDALRDAHEHAQPQPGEKWTSLHYGWTAQITASGDFELIHPPIHAGVVLGPRRHWDRHELRDWVRVPDPPTETQPDPADPRPAAAVEFLMLLAAPGPAQVELERRRRERKRRTRAQQLPRRARR